MANMIISCPSCPQKLRVPEDLFGKPVKCPKCGVTFEAAAPAPDEGAPVPGRASAPPAAPFAGHVVDTGDLPPPSIEERPTRRIRRDAEPSRGPLILTLGIVSIVLPVVGWIPGIAAITMGRSDQKKIRAGLMDRAGADSTQAGWICGIIGTCIQGVTCLGCGLYITFFAVMMAQFARNPPPGMRPPVIQNPKVEPAPKGVPGPIPPGDQKK
jgi:hypothetical protein